MAPKKPRTHRAAKPLPRYSQREARAYLALVEGDAGTLLKYLRSLRRAVGGEAKVPLSSAVEHLVAAERIIAEVRRALGAADPAAFAVPQPPSPRTVPPGFV